MKIDWIIYRIEQNEKGTISQNLILNKASEYDHICNNLELPYKSNSRNISCIQSGIYPFEKRIHQSRGRTIIISGVRERTNILVHIGNYLKDTQGCILPCMSTRLNKEGKEYIGMHSKTAIDQLWGHLPHSGYLHIISQA